MFTINEQNDMGLNDDHCEDCGDIVPHYVKLTADPKCPDCREAHSLMTTRCKHGMIEIMCSYCMGEVKNTPYGSLRVHDGKNGFGSSPTIINMNSFLMYSAQRLNSFRDPIIAEQEFF